jgi:hypothetical protein
MATSTDRKLLVALSLTAASALALFGVFSILAPGTAHA